MKRTKTYEIASFKALPEEGPGKFQAVVSVFGNVDFQGDRVVAGAFKKTLAKAREKGDLIPVIWAHEWLNPDAHIGYVKPEDAEELVDDQKSDGVNGGLMVKGTMDVHKPYAAQVFDLLKERRVKEWSFAYDIVREDKADDGANELLELDLLEVGPCLKGANPETYTVSAKSVMEAELKEAYAAERSLTKFLDLLQDVDDPEVADMLTKTQMKGTSDAPLKPRTINDDGSVPLTVDDAREVEGLPRLEKHGTGAGIIDESQLEGPTVDNGITEGGNGTEAKPWHIEKRGSQFCVIKDLDSSEVACHDTREEAEAQVRALYASEKTEEEPKAEDSDGEKVEFKWDGPAAMRTCKTAGDFRSIAFERANDSDPETAAHWTLPHHTHPGASADAGGVSAALGRLNQAGETVMSKESIRSHLERHQGGGEAAFDLSTNTTTTAASIPVTYQTSTDAGLTTWSITIPDGAKAGRVIGAKAASSLKTRLAEAVDEFVKDINGMAEAEPIEEKADEPDETKAETPTEWLDKLLDGGQ